MKQTCSSFEATEGSLGHSLRRKVVIGHPLLGRGGSEAVAMWLIEALKSKCDVTVLTTGGWNLTELNAYYGTQVKEDEVKVRMVPFPSTIPTWRAISLRLACFQRLARQIAEDYDLRISAFNLTDWGLRAIHFIADVSCRQELHQEFREKLYPRTQARLPRETMLRKAYLRFGSTAEFVGKATGRS